MSFSQQVWDQLRNSTCEDLIRALNKDGWGCDTKGGSAHIYKKGGLRVSVHYHPGKTYGPKLLKNLLADIGWSEDDMRRLKLIK